MFWLNKLCLTSQIGILWTLWYWLLKCMKNLKTPSACMIYQMVWCTGDTKDVLAEGSQTATDCFLSHWLQTDKAERSNALNVAIDGMCKKTRDLRRQVRPGQMKGRKTSWGILFQFAIFSLCILKIIFSFPFYIEDNCTIPLNIYIPVFKTLGENPAKWYCLNIYLYVCMSEYICCR